jgi:two-component system sensor histidine kinase KdpD
MVLLVSIGSSLVREGVGHLARLGTCGVAVSLVAWPTGRRGKAAQRAALARGSLLSAVDHTAALCELTRHITSIDLHREPGAQLAGYIRDSFAMEAVAIFDMDLDKTYIAGQWFAEPENHLRNVCMFERSSADPETGVISEVMRIGSLPIGSLLLRGEIDGSLVNGIANLIATTFDRYHSRANLNRVQSAREVERLRTTVLDSLAHTYKTPLTAIRAAATGVIEIGSLSKAQAELMTIIEEQSAVLNNLTMRLLTTARLEGHDLSLHKETAALAPLIDDAVSALRALYPALAVKITITPEEIELVCDRSLIGALLTQYLDNAGKYSEFESLVTVNARQEGESLLLSVHNFGPVIPWPECERIFERYVRGAATASNTPGTGIGLSIARAVAQAHGGDAWVTSDETEGTTFWASVPMREREASDE